MGTPESEDDRVVEAQPPTAEELTAFLTASPGALGGGDEITSLSVPRGNPLDLLTG